MERDHRAGRVRRVVIGDVTLEEERRVIASDMFPPGCLAPLYFLHRGSIKLVVKQ